MCHDAAATTSVAASAAANSGSGAMPGTAQTIACWIGNA